VRLQGTSADHGRGILVSLVQEVLSHLKEISKQFGMHELSMGLDISGGEIGSERLQNAGQRARQKAGVAPGLENSLRLVSIGRRTACHSVNRGLRPADKPPDFRFRQIRDVVVFRALGQGRKLTEHLVELRDEIFLYRHMSSYLANVRAHRRRVNEANEGTPAARRVRPSGARALGLPLTGFGLVGAWNSDTAFKRKRATAFVARIAQRDDAFAGNARVDGMPTYGCLRGTPLHGTLGGPRLAGEINPVLCPGSACAVSVRRAALVGPRCCRNAHALLLLNARKERPNAARERRVEAARSADVASPDSTRSVSH